MDFSALVRERYSVRSFSERPVSREQILALLEEARFAPTAVNYQPQRYLVLSTPESMEKLARCTKYTFHAPAAIIVCAEPSSAWVRPYDQDNAAVVDASIAATHLMLAIHDAGLGTTWVGHFDPAALREAFALPDGLVPVAVFPLGWPAENCKPSPKHAQRRTVEEITAWETFA
ncbi:MAG: nitroreductase family protein [Desulfovibrionaceae bacterium]|nr:nitroreductase family protein [Desulfovibrionaceae bacterium]